MELTAIYLARTEVMLLRRLLEFHIQRAEEAMNDLRCQYGIQSDDAYAEWRVHLLDKLDKAINKLRNPTVVAD